MTPIHRRRKSDKYPSREVMLEQQRDRALHDIETLKEDIAQLKRVIDGFGKFSKGK